jgi:hypothetical protein
VRERSRRFGRRHDISGYVPDAYINELRRHPRRSRKAGATWIDDSSIARNAKFYRVIVVQRLIRTREPWWQRQRQVG